MFNYFVLLLVCEKLLGYWSPLCWGNLSDIQHGDSWEGVCYIYDIDHVENENNNNDSN